MFGKQFADPLRRALAPPRASAGAGQRPGRAGQLDRRGASPRRGEPPARHWEQPARAREQPSRRAEGTGRRAETTGRRAETTGRRAETTGRRAEPPARRTAAPARRGEAAARPVEPPARRAEQRRGEERQPALGGGTRRRAGNDAQPRRVPAAAPAKAATQRRSKGRLARSLAGESAVPGYTPSIALRSIDGHLTRTATQVMAWYRLAPQAWSFRADGQRELLIQQIAAQLGELQGRWLHLRVTSRPYPVHRWAEAFDHNALGRPPDVAGALGWDAFLEGEQRHLMGLSMSEKEAFLGVEVSGRGPLDRWLDRAAPLLGKLAPRAARAELEALSSEVRHTDELVAGTGLDATPARADDIAWLMHRSCSLGLPAPRTVTATRATRRIDTEDLAMFTEGVELHQEPYAPTVKVVGRLRSQTITRHVAVLSVGLMGGLRIPEVDDPWMQRTDRLGFPVEWSARMYVRRPEEVTGELQRQMGKVRSQIRHYTHDHDLDPPMSLARQADRVVEIEDELSGGLTQANTRLFGWWRVAVAGRDEAEAISRAQQVLELYRPKVSIEHPEAQYRYAREFIPGEPLASTAYRRRGSVTWAAAGVPAATAAVGDRRGILLGETCTATRRPVAWDPWLAQEVRRASGLTAIVGGLGSGKSFLTGLIVYKTLRAGARWTVLDPSGPLARLTELPELAPFSRHINLLRADPGILNPYRVVAEPRLEHFLEDSAEADEEEAERAWRRERSLAGATRRRLVLDVLTGLLPYDVARLPHTRIVLLRAVREVGGGPDRNPAEVIDVLREHARNGEEHAGVVADFLAERRELPQAALLFPDEGREDPWRADRDYRLTVLTMQGMTLPRPGSPREEWTDGESLAVELLNLASWLTQRTIYDADRNLRKGVALDESHFLSQVPTGKVLIDRLARDSRKFNVRALFASQLAGDLLRVSGFASLVNAVFVGRTDDEEAQVEALRLLRVPTGVGYEQMLGTLSPRPRADEAPDDLPRQFVFADGHGGVEKIRIDLEAPHLAHLAEALDTNPDAARVAVSDSPTRPDPALPGGQRPAVHSARGGRRCLESGRSGGAPPGLDGLDDELDLFAEADSAPERVR
jgi:hypothetical protein